VRSGDRQRPLYVFVCDPSDIASAASAFRSAQDAAISHLTQFGLGTNLQHVKARVHSVQPLPTQSDEYIGVASDFQRSAAV
jgi:hypothetical protein